MTATRWWSPRATRPLLRLIEAWADLAPEFMAVGDCVRPRKILNAVRTGYDAAMAV